VTSCLAFQHVVEALLLDGCGLLPSKLHSSLGKLPANDKLLASGKRELLLPVRKRVRR
jgi:hypothetical protein